MTGLSWPPTPGMRTPLGCGCWRLRMWLVPATTVKFLFLWWIKDSLKILLFWWICQHIYTPQFFSCLEEWICQFVFWLNSFIFLLVKCVESPDTPKETSYYFMCLNDILTPNDISWNIILDKESSKEPTGTQYGISFYLIEIKWGLLTSFVCDSTLRKYWMRWLLDANGWNKVINN